MVWRNVRRLIGGALVVTGVVHIAATSVHAADVNRRLITVYDRGQTSVFLSGAKTIGQALSENGYQLDTRDTVEPSKDEELVAPDYRVNIYRARPVVIVDGTHKATTVTAHQTPQQIAYDAGVTMYAEDTADVQPSTDYLTDGAGLRMTIKRATPVLLDLYGNKTEVRTQAKTIKGLLDEKKIDLGKNGRVSVALDTVITAGMDVRVWREGKQTITINEIVPYSSEQVYDADREIGYKDVKTRGINGSRAVTYEIEIKEGAEVSRQQIAAIDKTPPTKEVVVVGVKPNAYSLTKAKGAQYFVDSKGVSHRETYYDLDMGRVMQACGQGGFYSIRSDGVKIDRDGYVIIAANLSRYPRCSIVETSVGLAKVYDTGGFAAVHPDGVDIATDWTNYNGR